MPCFQSFLFPEVKLEREICDSNSWFLSLFIPSWMILVGYGYTTTCCRTASTALLVLSSVGLGSNCKRMQDFAEQRWWDGLSYFPILGKGMISQLCRVKSMPTNKAISQDMTLWQTLEEEATPHPLYPLPLLFTITFKKQTKNAAICHI